SVYRPRNPTPAAPESPAHRPAPHICGIVFPPLCREITERAFRYGQRNFPARAGRRSAIAPSAARFHWPARYPWANRYPPPATRRDPAYAHTATAAGPSAYRPDCVFVVWSADPGFYRRVNCYCRRSCGNPSSVNIGKTLTQCATKLADIGNQNPWALDAGKMATALIACNMLQIVRTRDKRHGRLQGDSVDKTTDAW